MEHNDYYLLGSIVKTHGVKGNIVVRTDVDDPASYKQLKSIFIGTEESKEHFKVTSVSLSGEHLILHLEGIEDMDQAAELIRQQAFLPLSELPVLTGKKIYLHEAIGMTVIDKQKGNLGIIDKIYDLPEQPVCSLRFMEREVLFPLITVFIEKVDRQNRILYTDLPEGLIDLYLS
jgi:16S rRNA processing protein RimM